MGWVSLLRGLVALAATVAKYITDKQLIHAGEAKAINSLLVQTQQLTAVAKQVRSKALAEFDARGGVPDEDDPYLRD